MINNVTLIGNVGSVDDLKYTGGGMAVLGFSLATSRYVKDSDNKTTWHNVVVFAKTAEAMAKFLEKGKQVCVLGEIDNQTWVKSDGTKGYKSVINANSVKLLGSKSDSGVDKQDIKHIDQTVDTSSIPF